MAKKLLFVVNHPDFFLSHRLPIAHAAQRLGWDVVLASSRSPAADNVVKEGIRWIELPMQPGGVSPLADLRCCAALVGLYRREQPDLVHHVTIKPILYGGLASRAVGVPAVVNAFSGLGHLFMDDSPSRRVLRFAITRTLKVSVGHSNGLVILQNEDDQRDLLESGVLAPAQVEMIRGSGVDTAAFSPAPEPDGIPVVSLPTRMLWDKGVGEFVEAARRLREDGVHARFLLVGAPDSNNPSSIPISKLEEWDNSGVVEWTGHVDDMPPVYRRSHVVCLPSYREGLPKTLIEGAACGRPLVATDVPGCREIVRDGINGVLVPPRDGEALADAIAYLLDHPEIRQAFGARGREIVLDHFSLEQVVSQTMQLYRRLVGNDRAN